MAMSTGSKRERRPGVWELRVYAGRIDGRKRWVSRTFHGTEAQADAELLRLRVHVMDNPPEPAAPEPDIDDPTVAELLEQWYRAKHDDWTPTQPGIARGHIDNHLVPSLGAMRVAELRTRHIDNWVLELRNPKTGKPYAPSYVARIHGSLHAALERAVRHEIILRNPADGTELPTVRGTEKTVPTYPMLLAAVEAAGDDAHLRALIWIAAATGARRGQIAGLQWRDITTIAGNGADVPDTGLILMVRTAVKAPGGVAIKDETKTGAKIRVPLGPVTLAGIEDYRRHRQRVALAAGCGRLAPTSFVFSEDPAGLRPWYPDTPTKRWRKFADHTFRVLVDDAADPDDPSSWVYPLHGVKLNDLRHAHGTAHTAHGTDVRTLANRLGHSNPSTTMRVYSHSVTAAELAAALATDEWMTPPAADG